MGSDETKRAPKKGFWRKCRVCFRWTRILVWLVLLTVLSALVYLDLVGLPDFVKRPVVEQLRARGVDVEFSNLRWRWHRGIIAQNVRFGQASQSPAPQLSAKEVSVQLNLSALARLRFQVDGLSVHQGRLEWPDEPDAVVPLSRLNVEDIEAHLRLLPDDEWSLNDFQARFAGAKFRFSADIAHASAVRNWSVFQGRQPATTNRWPGRLRQLATVLEDISFDSPPDLRLIASGDARDPQSFNARLVLSAPGARTPWGNASQALLVARMFPATSNETVRGEITLRASTVETRWGWGNGLELAAALSPLSNASPAGVSLSLWTNVWPWRAELQCGLAELRSEKLNADSIVCNASWRAPRLEVINLSALFGGGGLDASADLDVVSRDAHFRMASDADPKSVEELLTPKTQRWLGKFSWASSPHVKASGSVVLPEWTDRQPEWREEVRPTLKLAGEFAATNGAYLGVQADWARSRFTYTNMVWNLPDLDVGRPEGTMHLAHTEDDRTRDYHWRIRGPLNPDAIRPVLNEKQLRGFDLFEFTEPLFVEGDVWGRLYEHDRIGFRGRVAATNFAVRGQSASTFESVVAYTNLVLELLEPHLTRGAQLMNASGVRVDFPNDRIHFTNGFAMAEPQAVADAIGPKVGRILGPYRFTIPPTVRVEGYAPLKGNDEADLHFDVDGGPFEWLKFRVPKLKGNVHWLNDSLTLSNVQGEFYRGTASGRAQFEFERGKSNECDFNFVLTFSDTDLGMLMADVSPQAKRLEGLLSGSVTITDAHSTDWDTWNGLGQVRLRDGFIWDIPVFGVLSPVLDAIIPGLGSSRANEANAAFIITNGVIYSSAINIRSPMMRLNYSGAVGFDGNVNARVEAELLRDAWFVGRVISLVFAPVTKLLEYKISGTLSKPKAEPVYIPKILFLPLHPLRTLDDLFPGGGTTNAPPDSPRNTPARTPDSSR